MVNGLNQTEVNEVKKENTTKVLAAADAWWNSLTKQQQKDYVKKHPNSKYAKSGLSSGGNKYDKAKPQTTKHHSIVLKDVKRLSSLLGAYQRISFQEHNANMENDGSPRKQAKWQGLDKKLGDILKMVKKEFPKVDINLFKDGNTSAKELIKMTMEKQTAASIKTIKLSKTAQLIYDDKTPNDVEFYAQYLDSSSTVRMTFNIDGLPGAKKLLMTDLIAGKKKDVLQLLKDILKFLPGKVSDYNKYTKDFTKEMHKAITETQAAINKIQELRD